MAKRYYSNAASQASLSAAIGATDTSITFTAGTFTGYPTQFPYTAAIARGTADEEIVLVTASSGNQVTVTRAYDGTVGKAHGAGSTFTEVVVAQDYREANDHVQATTGVHGVAGNLVGDTDVQTLTGKTLTNPTVSDGTFTGIQTVAHANVTTLTVTGVTTVATPVNPTDAATKAYADALGTTAATASTIVRRDASGGFAVSFITISNAPSAGTDGANKTYVDGKTWPTSAITDAASAATASVIVKRDAAGRAQFVDPSAAQDAATKTYVDTAITGTKGPQVQVRRHAAQSIPNGAFTLLQFDSVDWDTNSTFVLGTPTYITIAKAGYYDISGTVDFAGSAGGGRRIAQVQVNGASVSLGNSISAGSSADVGPSFSGVLALNVGDKVYLEAFQDCGAALNTGDPAFNPTRLTLSWKRPLT